MSCRKHEPEPAITVPDTLSDSAKLSFALWQGSGFVRCRQCGMLGAYTNGRQKAGVSKPRWFRSPDGAKHAEQEIAKWAAWVREQMSAGRKS